MILVIGCALAATLGVALIARALVPNRPSLSAQVDQLLGTASGRGRQGPASLTVSPSTVVEGVTRGLWDLLDRDGDRFPALVSDLAVMDQTPATFVRQVITAATLLPVIVGLLFVALATIGIHAPTAAAVVVAAAAAGIGAVLPRPSLRAEANKRRSEMREVVAVLCDLAAVIVAAGEDADGALMQAASAGQGWAFDAVRRALATMTTRTGAWETLHGLGERLKVEELVTLAQNMGLAEQQGAKVRDALNAQAKSLREIVAAEVETKAGGATDSMSVPLALLGIGFMIMIGYPALAKF